MAGQLDASNALIKKGVLLLMPNKVMLYPILDITGFHTEGAIWSCHYGTRNFAPGFKFNTLPEKYVDLGSVVPNLTLKRVPKRDSF